MIAMSFRRHVPEGYIKRINIVEIHATEKEEKH